MNDLVLLFIVIVVPFALALIAIDALSDARLESRIGEYMFAIAALFWRVPKHRHYTTRTHAVPEAPASDTVVPDAPLAIVATGYPEPEAIAGHAQSPPNDQTEGAQPGVVG